MKLKMEHLFFSYWNSHSKKDVFCDLSFMAEEGEFISIIGPSGCGKSTILNILAGILIPNKGKIYVDEQPVYGNSAHFAYMPQNDLLFPWKTILENVCLYGKIHHKEAKIKKQALDNFPIFGLEGYENCYPSSLSGGMRQRAAFLRTALCEADILLLDEPFGALDVITRTDMQDWLISMRKQLNKTTILVTHDIDEAIYLSDRILILSGSPASITKIIKIEKINRNREWLYEQSELRTNIYQFIRGIGAENDKELSINKNIEKEQIEVR